jgi:hypothetical protein
MTLVFFLEEPSAKALMEGLLPTLLGEDASALDVRYVVFEGKQDLEKNLVKKLRGWSSPGARFVVLRDQDSANCREVKNKLSSLVAESGREALVRVACHELESWILGNLPDVAEEYDSPHLLNAAKKSKFRNPDALGNPVQELRRLVPDYQKIDGARRMGARLNPETNSSTSFRVFCQGILRLMAAPEPSPGEESG